MMKRLALLSATVAAGGAALASLTPTTASAQAVELGQTTTPVAAPSCPRGVTLSNCRIVLTRTTAIQAVSDSLINPTRVNQQGWVVAFSVGLSRLSSNAKQAAAIIHGLDRSYGGNPELALTVLRPGPHNTFTAVAQSGTYQLTPFLGRVLQEPLSLPPSFTTFTALPVQRGDVIGLTVPTWAPVLTYQLPSAKFAYRQSRRANCKNPAASQTAQTKLSSTYQYLCNYPGTRVEYTATEITDTNAPRTYVH